MGYKDELGVILINHGLDPVVIEDGERVAQLVLNKIEHIQWNSVSELNNNNNRGGGFGHSGTR